MIPDLGDQLYCNECQRYVGTILCLNGKEITKITRCPWCQGKLRRLVSLPPVLNQPMPDSNENKDKAPAPWHTHGLVSIHSNDCDIHLDFVDVKTIHYPADHPQSVTITLNKYHIYLLAIAIAKHLLSDLFKVRK